MACDVTHTSYDVISMAYDVTHTSYDVISMACDVIIEEIVKLMPPLWRHLHSVWRHTHILWRHLHGVWRHTHILHVGKKKNKPELYRLYVEADVRRVKGPGLFESCW